MTRYYWLRRCVLPTALATACVTPAAHALRMELGAGVGAEYTSNVDRSETNEEQELIGVTWGGLSVREDAANLSAEVAGAVESRQYINDEAGDDILLSLASMVDWMVLPQRLNLHFEDYYQQARQNPLATYSPRNQQDTNVLWTGPDLYLRFAKLYTVQLSGRFGDFYYEDTNGDNQRLAAFVRGVRALSPTSEIYVQAGRTRTEYDNAGEVDVAGAPLVDFHRTDAMIGFQWSSVLTDFTVEGGQSQVDRDEAEDVDEPFARLLVRRRLPRESVVGLRLATQLTDSGDSLLTSQGGRLDVDPNTVDITQDIARVSDANLFYNGRWFAGELGARAYWRDEDYETADELDQREFGIRLGYDYPLSPLWTARAFGGYSDIDYVDDALDRRDRRYIAGIGAAHRVSRRISIDLELRDEWQQSTGADAVGRDFNEIVALIELRYGDRPTWSTR